MLEHNWLARSTPGDFTSWNWTTRCADVFTHGKIKVMPVESGSGIAFGVPELCETRIEIYIDFAA